MHANTAEITPALFDLSVNNNNLILIDLFEHFQGNLDQVREWLTQNNHTFASAAHEAVFNNDMVYFQERSRAIGAARMLDAAGHTALHYAVILNHLDLLKQLAPYEQEEAKDEQGMDALLLAVSLGRIEAIRLLLNDRSVRLRTVDSKGNNALHIAILTKDEFFFAELLKLVVNHRERFKTAAAIENQAYQSPWHILITQQPLRFSQLLKGLYPNAEQRTQRHLEQALVSLSEDGLEPFNLSGIGINDHQLGAYAPSIAPKATSFGLDLSHNKLGHDCAPGLVSLVSDNLFQAPIRFDLSSNPIGGRLLRSSGVVQLIQGLQNAGKSIHELALMGCNVDDTDACAIAALLSPPRFWPWRSQGIPAVSVLDLRNNPKITAKGQAALRAISGLKVTFNGDQQTRLDLSRSHLGALSGGLLVSLLTRNPELEELILDGNALGQQGYFASSIQVLAKVLKSNTMLRRLSLAHCKLTDKDLIALGELLKVNKTLRSLNIKYNKSISPAAMSEFVMLLKSTTHGLQSLEVGTGIIDPLSYDKVRLALQPKTPSVERLAPPAPILIPLDQVLPEFSQVLQNYPVQALSETEKQALIRAKEAGKTLTEQQALNLFVAIFIELKATQPNLMSSILHAQLEHEVNWLSQYDRFMPLKGVWQHLSTSSDSVASQMFQEKVKQYFEASLARKLSTYWLTVNCLETQLVELSSSEIEQLFHRFHLLTGMIFLSVTSHYHVFHGFLSILEHICETIHELIGRMHVLEFVLELPGLHGLFHHIKKVVANLGDIPQAQMLKNVSESFVDYNQCNDYCLGLAKSIYHHYNLAERLDSLESAGELAQATSLMVLDYWKVASFKHQDPDVIQDTLLEWIFIANAYVYQDKANQITFGEKKLLIRDLYTLPGLEFKAKDEHGQDVILRCDMTLQFPPHKELKNDLLKTNRVALGCRKGSKTEARLLMNHRLKGVPVAAAEEGRVSFQMEASDIRIDESSIEAFEFRYVTQREQIEQLKSQVAEHSTRIGELEAAAQSDKKEICILRAENSIQIEKLNEEIAAERDRATQIEIKNSKLEDVWDSLFSYLKNQCKTQEDLGRGSTDENHHNELEDIHDRFKAIRTTYGASNSQLSGDSPSPARQMSQIGMLPAPRNNIQASTSNETAPLVLPKLSTLRQ